MCTNSATLDEMPLTALQESAVEAWRRGNNVRVVAVPGAGKSRVLVEACRCSNVDRLCIILAYNRALKDETDARLQELGMEEWVMCMTFHGLASKCRGQLVHDDIALAEFIEYLQRGGEPAERLGGIGYVLIDEAQDFKRSFYDLITRVIEPHDNMQYMVVGDPRQMLYDYDDEDPASLEYIRSPETYFCSMREWTSVVLDQTHRMTPEITEVVNRVFKVDMQSTRTSVGTPVEVYSISMWKAGALVSRLLKFEQVTQCCIIAPSIRSKQIEKVVNYLEKYNNTRLYVHGIDGQDARVKRNKLSVSTWHASKGTQKRVCVVFGVSNLSDANPAFVAFTRAQDRLVIIHDESNPYMPLLRTLEQFKDAHNVVTFDASTRALIANMHNLSTEAPSECVSDVIDMNRWRPSGSGRWLCGMMEVLENEADTEVEEVEEEDEDELVAGLVGTHEDVAHVYLTACLMAAEWEMTRSVRRMIDIRMPARMAREMQEMQLRNGSDARFVSPNISDDALLDETYRKRIAWSMLTAETPIPAECWCFMACASLAWNSYHHTLRQLDPFDWMDSTRFRRGVDIVLDALDDSTAVRFDVRLRATHDERVVHARCDATTEECAYIFVWQSALTHKNKMDAAILAALHPSRMCTIINLRNEGRQRISVDGHESRILDRLVEQQTRRAPRSELPSGDV